MTPLEVLKNKEKGVMLYSPCYGHVKFFDLQANLKKPIGIKDSDGYISYLLADGKCQDSEGAQVMLFPSKNMQDWDKFSWEKGDKLITDNDSALVEFLEYVTNDEQPDDNYTTFRAKVIHPEGAAGNIGTFFTECFTPVSKTKNKPLYYVALTKGVLADDACIVPSMGMCYVAEMDGIKNMKVCCGHEVVTVKFYNKRKEALSFIQGFVAGRIDVCKRIISEYENKILNYKKGFREKYGETLDLISNGKEGK